MNKRCPATLNTSDDELFGLSRKLIDFSELVRLPVLEQQRGSITPLEKAQIGLLMAVCQPKIIVETGVWRGRTTRFLSEFLTLNSMEGHVYGFDLPEILSELRGGDPWFQMMSNITLIPGSLPGSLLSWLASHDRTIDFALVDAYHSYYAVLKELSAIASRLSDHGYILCHDYGKPHSKYEGVMCAVNDVAEHFDLSVLPFWSRGDSAPECFCQAAILHRRAYCSTPRKLFHWRKYFAQEYPMLATFWGQIRHFILRD
jgi:hypothetical protein